MIKNKFETVSTLIDNEALSDTELAEIIDDAELSDTWSRYHLIGDVMRNDAPAHIQLDLSANIAQAIAEEPTILAPKAAPNKSAGILTSVKSSVVKFIKPVGQLAIAASAAGLMIIGVQQNVATNDITQPNQVLQTVPFGGVADPVSFNYQTNDHKSQKQAYLEQQRRFQALLTDHQQQIKFGTVAKVATDETAEDEIQKAEDPIK